MKLKKKKYQLGATIPNPDPYMTNLMWGQQPNIQGQYPQAPQMPTGQSNITPFQIQKKGQFGNINYDWRVASNTIQAIAAGFRGLHEGREQDDYYRKQFNPLNIIEQTGNTSQQQQFGMNYAKQGGQVDEIFGLPIIKKFQSGGQHLNKDELPFVLNQQDSNPMRIDKELEDYLLQERLKLANRNPNSIPIDERVIDPLTNIYNMSFEDLDKKALIKQQRLDKLNPQEYKNGGDIKEQTAEFKKAGLTPEKAGQMLKDNSAHNHPLTAKQKHYFGMIASGKMKYQPGGLVNTTGYLDGSQTASNPYNIIPGDDITMKGVSKQIQATPIYNGIPGQPTVMHPGLDYSFKGAESVHEQPFNTTWDGSTPTFNFNKQIGRKLNLNLNATPSNEGTQFGVGITKSFQQGGRAPITVTNPNDPRLKAYNDSLVNYNHSQAEVNYNQQHWQSLVNRLGLSGQAAVQKATEYIQSPQDKINLYKGKMQETKAELDEQLKAIKAAKEVRNDAQEKKQGYGMFMRLDEVTKNYNDAKNAYTNYVQGKSEAPASYRNYNFEVDRNDMKNKESDPYGLARWIDYHDKRSYVGMYPKPVQPYKYSPSLGDMGTGITNSQPPVKNPVQPVVYQKPVQNNKPINNYNIDPKFNDPRYELVSADGYHGVKWQLKKQPEQKDYPLANPENYKAHGNIQITPPEQSQMAQPTPQGQIMYGPANSAIGYMTVDGKFTPIEDSLHGQLNKADRDLLNNPQALQKYTSTTPRYQDGGPIDFEKDFEDELFNESSKKEEVNPQPEQQNEEQQFTPEEASQPWLSYLLGDDINMAGKVLSNTGSGFQSFTTPEQGRAALEHQLELYKTGHTKTGIKPTDTLFEAMSHYAPASDHNDPLAYASKIARNLGVSIHTPISRIDTKKWADEITKVEGNKSGNNNPGNLRRYEQGGQYDISPKDLEKLAKEGFI